MGTVTESSAAGVPVDSSMFGATQEKGLDLNLDLARSLRMRRSLAIVAGLLTLIVLVLFGLSRKPVYEASSLIYVQPLVPKLATDASSGYYDSARYDFYIQQQLLTFRRPDILAAALDELAPSTRAIFSANQATAIRQIASGLSVDRPAGSYQIKVSVERGDPSTASQVANAVTAAYLHNGQQDDQAIADQQVKSLTQERERIRDELVKERQAQAGLSGSLGVADTAGDYSNPFDAQLAELRTQIAAARQAHDVAEAQLASVENRAEPSTLDSAADTVTRSDGELYAMKSALGTRRGVLLAEMNGLTPENPLYKKDQAELDGLSQTIDKVTKQVGHQSGQSLKRQLVLAVARTGDVLARLEADLARQTAAATSGTPKMQHAQDVADAVKLLQTRYASVDNAIHAITLAQSPSFSAHVSLLATPPSSPVASRKLVVLALALPFAIIFAVIAAVIRQKLDTRVYIGADINRVLDIAPMAVLPDPVEVGSKVAKEFIFRLVAGIDQAHRAGRANTVVFTACSEETSIDDLVSAAVAEMETLGYSIRTMSAAETRRPVDLTRASSPLEWGDSTELVRSIDKAVVRVRRESLTDENLEGLKQQADMLFIKAQPLRSSAETEFVVRFGDLAVLIAESGKTARSELRSCLSLVRQLKARGLSVVVNDLKLHNADRDFIKAVRFAERRPESNNRPGKFSDGLVLIDRV